MSNIELVSCRSVSRHVWREYGGLGQPDWQAVALNASGLKKARISQEFIKESFPGARIASWLMALMGFPLKFS